MKSKHVGTVFIFGSLYYLIAEFICALNFNDTFLIHISFTLFQNWEYQILTHHCSF